MVIWQNESASQQHGSVLGVSIAHINYLRRFICMAFTFSNFIVLLTFDKIAPKWSTMGKHWQSDSLIDRWSLTEFKLQKRWWFAHHNGSRQLGKVALFWFLGKNLLIYAKNIDFFTFDGWLMPDWLTASGGKPVVHPVPQLTWEENQVDVVE